MLIAIEDLGRLQLVDLDYSFGKGVSDAVNSAVNLINLTYIYQ